MSRIVAQFDPSAGSGSFQAGAVNRCSALWIMNESLNFLQLDFGAAETSKIIQPWSNKLIRLTNPVQTVNWSVAATLQATGAPVSVVFVETYDSSEDMSALISGPLSRQTNVGNPIDVATTSQLINDSSASGTQIIEARPTGAAGPSVQVTNDGNITMRGALTIAFNTGLLPPSVQLSDNGNDLALVIGGLAGPGADGGYAFGAVSNGANVMPFGIAQSPGVSPLSWIDGAGVLHATAPVTLVSGHQETGYMGIQFVAAGAGQTFGVGVNFKTVLTNTPSSITATLITSANVNSVIESHITPYGFFLGVTSTAAGAGFYVATYTTVGN